MVEQAGLNWYSIYKKKDKIVKLYPYSIHENSRLLIEYIPSITNIRLCSNIPRIKCPLLSAYLISCICCLVSVIIVKPLYYYLIMLGKIPETYDVRKIVEADGIKDVGMIRWYRNGN